MVFTGLGGVQAFMIVPDLKLVIIERTDTDGDFEDKGTGMEFVRISIRWAKSLLTFHLNGYDFVFGK